MRRLEARYILPLSVGVVIKRAEGDLPSYTTTIDDFDIVISLLPYSTGGNKTEDDLYFTSTCTRLQLTCTHDEDEAPPPPSRTSNAGKDYTTQAQYFDQRVGEYSRRSIQALNRFFAFLRYSLRQAAFDPVEPRHEAFANPKWHDECGTEVGKGTLVWIAEALPTRFGVIPLERSHDSQVSRGLSSDYEPALHEEFLANAQDAAFESNVRRAVLELAIACEVAIKHKFFGEASPSALSIEHLESKGSLRLRAIDLIKTTSKEVFGDSFSDAHPAECHDIDHLFRCRNKIAHRGRPEYKDQSGILHVATIDTCEEWIASVRVMLEWLLHLQL